MVTVRLTGIRLDSDEIGCLPLDSSGARKPSTRHCRINPKKKEALWQALKYLAGRTVAPRYGETGSKNAERIDDHTYGTSGQYSNAHVMSVDSAIRQHGTAPRNALQHRYFSTVVHTSDNMNTNHGIGAGSSGSHGPTEGAHTPPSRTSSSSSATATPNKSQLQFSPLRRGLAPGMPVFVLIGMPKMIVEHVLNFCHTHGAATDNVADTRLTKWQAAPLVPLTVTLDKNKISVNYKMLFTIIDAATGAERLDSSPLTKANWVQSPAGPHPDFRKDLPFPPSLHSGTAPLSTHFTLIGSQDLVVKSHLNLST
ncbi:hypothetical protein PR048_011076 [Dryococelus australis]|uniref:Uncharacterized protein n=1 Tax=Dryococelus australis TaxID=614101 RepID=A0ABQ9HKJ4_9NEOP|nr:hypothetical protein PR048_011076 [Dryococelus australis]